MLRAPKVTMVTTLVALGVLAFAAVILFRVEGGRYFLVQTPSMGTEAPRGSLLLTKPIAAVDVEKGDFLSFRNPKSGTVYSHRAVDVTPEGILTKGDVNAVPDAWVITDRELIGKVFWHAPDVGWIIRAIPAIGLGWALIWLATRRARAIRRYSYRIVGYPLVVSLVCYIMKPWVGLGTLGQRLSEDGDEKLMVDLISTGILPITVGPKGGEQSERLVNGATTTVGFDTFSATKEYLVTSHLALTFWWWVGLLAFCLIPLAWALLFGPSPSPEPTKIHEDEDAHSTVDEDREVLA